MAEPRARDREVGALLRMSKEDKAGLEAEAKDLGISLQVLLERRVFGRDAQNRPPGRTTPSQPELPLTG